LREYVLPTFDAAVKAGAGKETVILYVRDEVASLAPPGKRVKRFSKIYLEPGQS